MKGLLLILLVGTAAISCQWSENERPKTVINLQGIEASCLDHSVTILERYFDLTANDWEVSQAWNCVNGVLTTFERRVRGDNSEVYQKSELRHFVDTYYLNLGEPLWTQIFRLKQFLVGGSSETLTRKELRRLTFVLQVLKQETIRLQRFLAILTLQASSVTDDERLEAVQQLQNSAVSIGKVLEQNSVGVFELHSLEDLFVALRDFNATRGQDITRSQKLIDNLSAIKTLKGVFIGGGDQTITAKEWPTFLQRLARAYKIYLRYHYQLSSQDVRYGAGLAALRETMAEVFVLLRETITQREDKKIGYHELSGMIDQVYRTEVVTLPFSKQATNNLMAPLFEKALNPAKKGVRGPAQGGLTLNGLNWLQRDFDGWAQMQAQWEQMVQATRGDPLTTSLSGDVVQANWLQQSSSTPWAKQELDLLLSRPIPMSFKNGILHFCSRRAEIPYDLDSFTSLNWKRLFISAALRGYSQNALESRWKGLTLKEFEQFYRDLREMAEELKFLDPRDIKVYQSTFLEANTFLFSADGNVAGNSEYISFVEGVEVLAFALSGSQFSRRAYRDIRHVCVKQTDVDLPLESKDVFGLPFVDVDCYRSRFRQQFAVYYEEMKEWVQLVSRFNNDEWNLFQCQIEQAARKAGFTHKIAMESVDIDRSTMILQYIESVFLRFDKDHSNTLSLAESRALFPYLKSVLQAEAGFDDEEELFDLFTYILAKGRILQRTAEDWVNFKWWKNFADKSFEVDRQRLLKIIGMMANPPTGRNACAVYEQTLNLPLNQ